MSENWIDPGSLEGDTLRRWYQKSPAEIEEEREAAAARRYQDFFHGSATGSPAPRTADAVAPHRSTPRLAASLTTPVAPRPVQPIAYGALRSPAPSDQELTELRRQQATFASTTRKIDLQNSWFAAPVLAGPLAVMGLEGAAAWAARSALPQIEQAPLHFAEREAWQRGAQRAAQALSDAEKGALRKAARTKFARANGISASEMQAEVHHSDPLEWAHLKPDADPNRLANLWGLRGEAHDIATRAWADFGRALKGRIPTQAELMAAKLRIDRMVEPFIRREGVPRSNTPLREGGPI